MGENVPPPVGFDDPFFCWLDQMSEVLSIQFVSTGNFPDPVLSQLDLRMGRCLPVDLRRFYARYNPWAGLQDWFAWESWQSTERTIGQAIGATAPLAPIDCRSVSSQGYDTVAVVYSPERYEVVERWRATGKVRRFPSLRSYYIAGVLEGIRNDEGSSEFPDTSPDPGGM